MRVFHLAAMIVLVVAMLPWGAYSAARPAPPMVIAQQISGKAPGPDRAQAEVSRAPLAAPAARKCRTGLPGAPCVTDAVLTRSVGLPATSPPVSHPRSEPCGLAARLTLSDIFHPPRSC